jgi:RNA polymerase sigma-70 factor (ECF subfamily)
VFDEKGFERIMDTHMAFVYTIVCGKLASVCRRQDIEECVSDVFYELYRTRHAIDPEKGSLKAYIAVIAKRRAIDLFRKRASENETVSIDAGGCDWAASDDNVEKSITDRETGDLLIREIKNLGEPDSGIVIRKYYFGQTAKGISKALGMKENTVNKRASRALGKLKEALGGAL